MEDIKGYPINYNHHYIDTIKSRRRNRQRAALAETVKQATKTTSVPAHHGSVDWPTATTTVDLEQVVKSWTDNTDRNMENFSCEEALDCLLAIYKVRFHLGSSNPNT